MDRQRFVEEVMSQLPEETAGHKRSSTAVEGAIRLVLEQLGAALSRLEAAALAEELPSELSEALTAKKVEHPFDIDRVTWLLAVQLQLRAGQARELLDVICSTVAQAVRGEVLKRFRAELTEEEAALFQVRTMPEPHLRQHVDPTRRTLAEGRSGGGRPLYAASMDRAQEHSVASNANPHADTKLSSARGLTQEREEESLATGRPGSTRPLNEAKR